MSIRPYSSVVSTVPSAEFHHIALERIANEMDLYILALCKTVSKLWKKALDAVSDDPVYIEKCAEREGFSLVNGSGRKHCEDVKILYSMTISGRRIGRLYGNVVGKVPPISKECFDVLLLDDPFGKGKIKDNFAIVVVPSKLEIACGGETQLCLDEQKNLIKVPDLQIEKKDCEMPFSVRNFIMLCIQKKDVTGFNIKSTYYGARQCGAASCVNRVYLIRKSTPDIKAGDVKSVGLKVTNLIEFGPAPYIARLVLDAVLIAESTKFPIFREYFQICCGTDHPMPIPNHYRCGVRENEPFVDTGYIAPSCRVDVPQLLSLDKVQTQKPVETL